MYLLFMTLPLLLLSPRLGAGSPRGELSEPTPRRGVTSIILAIFPVMAKVPESTYLPGLVSIHRASWKSSSRKPAVPKVATHRILTQVGEDPALGGGTGAGLRRA